MYSEFNTIVRKKLNAASFDYNGNDLPVYFTGEWESDQGAHVRSLVFSNQPEAQEVGYSATESVSGYLQLGIFLPTSDKGLDYSLNDLASQVHSEFQRGSFVDGEFKAEWLNVQRENPVRIDGHMIITMRVNYRYFYCN